MTGDIIMIALFRLIFRFSFEIPKVKTNSKMILRMGTEMKYVIFNVQCPRPFGLVCHV